MAVTSYHSDPYMQALGSHYTPSMLFNNLSASGTSLAYARKRAITTVARASLADPSSPAAMRQVPYSTPASVLQATWCQVSDDRWLLAVATTAGVEVWTVDPDTQILAVDIAKLLPEDGLPLLGRLYVGVSTGSLVEIDASSGPLTHKVVDGHSHAVTCVTTAGDASVVSGDEHGNLRQWDAAAGMSLLASADGDGAAVTSVASRSGFVVAGFTTGHVRLYSLATDGLPMFAEVAGHTRCISAVDVHPKLDMFVAASVDGTLTVWSLPEPEKVELVVSKRLGDQPLTGVQFLKSGRPDIVTAAYDITSLSVIAES